MTDGDGTPVCAMIPEALHKFFLSIRAVRHSGNDFSWLNLLSLLVIPTLTLCLVFVDSDHHVWALFFLALFIEVFAFFYPVGHDGTGRHFRLNLLLFALLIIVSLAWNYSFRAYFVSSGFSSDIFRGAFYNFHSPLYGDVRRNPVGRYCWPMIAAGILFAFFIAYRTKHFHKKETWFFGIGFLLLFILTFAYSSGVSRIVSYASHYAGVVKAFPYFDSLGDVLRTYDDVMPMFGSELGHYPPGNLLVFMIDAMYLPYFTKIFVLLCCLLTPVPMCHLLKGAGFSHLEANMAALLFATTAPVLIFPSIALTPIPMFLTAAVTALCFSALNQDSLSRAACLGLAVAILTMFSFVSAIVVFLLAVFAFLLLLKQEVQARFLVRHILVSATVFIVFFAILYFAVDFDIMKCFRNAVAHNKEVMSETAFDDVFRYLLRSTGNIIPFLMVIGSPALTFFILGLRRNRLLKKLYCFSIALIISILLSGFSGLFYMETERIWLFFVPPILMVAATEASALYREGNYFTVASFLVLGVTQAVIYELFVDHSLGFFI